MPDRGAVTVRRQTAVVAGLVALVALILGLNMVALKVAMVGSGPFTVQALAGVVATVVFFGVARASGAPLVLERRSLPAAAAVGLALTVGSSLGVAAGVQRVSAGVASLLMSMTPVFTLILGSALLSERTTGLGLAGVAAAFGGVALVAVTADGGASSELLGVLFMLLGAASWAAGIVLMRLLAGDVTRSTFVAWQTLLGVPVLAVAAVLIEGFAFLWSLPFAIGVFYAGAFSKGTSFFLQLTIVRLSSATVASLTAFLIPVFGTLAGVILLGEDVRPGQLYGGAVILMGVSLVLRAGPSTRIPALAP